MKLRPATPDDIPAIVELFDAGNDEAFEDSWEHVREPYEEWSHDLLEAESFDPTLWFLA